MTKSKIFLAASSLFAAMSCGFNAQAQSTSFVPAETFFTAGSSAQFNTFGIAGSYTVPPASGPLCGTNHWSKKSASTAPITIVDPRSSSIVPEPANVWIAWDNNFQNGVAGQGVICIYASVDSIVGVRAYEARASLSLNTSLAGAAGANLIPLSGNDVALPASVLAWINANVKINAANTDIRPEDAKFASMRVLTAAGTQVTGRGITGVGYGPFPIGTPIKSSQSSTTANPVDFAIDPGDVDPINSGNAVRGYAEVAIGAAPVVVFANVSQTGSGHLGDGNYTNVNRFILSKALEGNITHVRDLGYGATYNASSTSYNNYNLAGETDQPIHVFLREPLSGTYNTMEFSIPMSREIDGDDYAPNVVLGQETGVNASNTSCTTTPCTVESGNPLYHIASNGATRARAVGTGEMVTAVNGTADAIGYAFWGFGTFQGKANVKYLTVDGVDPLFSGPSANSNGVGVFPTCATSGGVATSCTGVPFTNIINGTYPIWSKYRLIYDASVSSNIATAMVVYAQNASHPTTGVIQDFVPASFLQTFHSHYAQVVRDNGVAYGPNNGIKYQVPETGGDMGGAVFTIQSELDFLNDTNNQQTSVLQ
jgi:hypothetical protein